MLKLVNAPLRNGCVGTFVYDIGANKWTWSPEMYDRRGLDPTAETPTLDLLLAGVLEDDRPALKAAFVEAVQRPGSFSARYRVDTPTQGERSMLLVGRSTSENGCTGELRGFTVDITESLAAYASDAVHASAEHRAAIEQVKGALMLAYNLTEDEAFAVLRKASNDLNEKISHLADRVARRLAEPHTDPSQSPLQTFEQYLRP